MPYNYKQEAAKYMEQIKNEKDNSDKLHALKAIIGMMWQTGVDNVNDLPEKAAYTSPEVLAAELNINSPFKTMTAKKMVDLIWKEFPVGEYTSPEKINEFFKSFKEHEKFKDPKVIEEENERRELHSLGMMSAGELYLAANYDPNKDKRFYLYGDNVKMSEEEYRPMWIQFQSLSELSNAFGAINDLGDNNELKKDCEPVHDAIRLISNKQFEKRAKSNKGLKAAQQKLAQIPALLDRKIDTPSEYQDIELYKDGMTLYDLMDMQLGGGFGDHLLANTLSGLDWPIPEAGKKAQQREAEFIEKDKLAKQEIDKNGWRTVDQVRERLTTDYQHDPSAKLITEWLTKLWDQIDENMFPEDMQADIKHTKKIADNVTHLVRSNPKYHTNTNMLELYQKTKKLPELFQTQIDVPERYREKYGDKMSYMSYFREQYPEILFGQGMPIFQEALENVNGYYGLGIDMAPVFAQSDKELSEKQEKKWADELLRQNLKYAQTELNEKTLLHDEARIQNEDEQKRLETFREDVYKTFTKFPEHLALKKGTFSTKNKSLQPLKTMIEDLNNMTDPLGGVGEKSDMEMVDKLFEIHAEAKRISELDSTKNNQKRKDTIDAILKSTRDALADKRILKTIEKSEAQQEAQQAAPEKSQQTMGEGFIEVKQQQLAMMPSASEACKTPEEAEAYKQELEMQLSKLIAAKILAKSLADAPAKDKDHMEPMTLQEQIAALDENDPNSTLSDVACQVRQRKDFDHMIKSAGLSTDALEELRQKGASGNLILNELSKHAKIVIAEEHKKEKAAAEKKVNPNAYGMGKK